jgi:hypothetical protein
MTAVVLRKTREYLWNWWHRDKITWKEEILIILDDLSVEMKEIRVNTSRIIELIEPSKESTEED